MPRGDLLLKWFETHRRALPWRREPRDPYRVLVSEFMLQQTQVERVSPRFEAFVNRFPDLESLATAGEQDVLEAWSGLGYYRRARALHAAARAIRDAGAWPETARELQDLPGVGPYTAAAVASLAFGQACPVLDGNVLRVGARVLALDGDVRRAPGKDAIAGFVTGLIEETGDPAAVNEALMELGATVCRLHAPECHRCPLAAACRARASGFPERWPEPRRSREPERLHWAAAVIVDPGGRWLLRRVESGPVLRGLWLPPMVAVEDAARARAAALGVAPLPVEPLAQGVLPAVRHSITHRRIAVHPVPLRVSAPAEVEGHRWADPERPGLPTSSLLGKLARRVVEAAGLRGFPPPGGRKPVA